MQEESVSYGDYVVLVHRNKRWLVQVERGRKFGTHVSQIALDDLVGVSYGSAVGEYMVLRPTLEDMVMKFRRPTQIVYPKDAGYIVLKLGVSPGKRVLELGTGSGAMTAYFASLVGPSGKVYTYEANDAFREVAMENLRKAGLQDHVEFRGAAGDQVEEGAFDCAFIDVGDPWDLVSFAHRALRPSAPLGILLPTYDQLERAYSAFKGPFMFDEALEILMRRMQVLEGKTRPETRMIGHTAFLMFWRAVKTQT